MKSRNIAELQMMETAGGFDLDPCAATRDRRRARVKARLLLTAEDDGLAVAWRGRVFVNPPYGRALKAWVAKCAGEATGSGAVVVALVPARPDTRWWHDHVAGKLRFSNCRELATVRPHCMAEEAVHGNRSQHPNSLITGNLTGNFTIFRPFLY